MTDFQNRMDDIVRSTGLDLSRKYDHVIKTALKREAPFAFWLLSNFQYRWLAKLLGFEIRKYQGLDSFHYTFEVLIFRRVIGRAKVDVNLTIV